MWVCFFFCQSFFSLRMCVLFVFVCLSFLIILCVHVSVFVYVCVCRYHIRSARHHVQHRHVWEICHCRSTPGIMDQVWQQCSNYVYLFFPLPSGHVPHSWCLTRHHNRTGHFYDIFIVLLSRIWFMKNPTRAFCVQNISFTSKILLIIDVFWKKSRNV